MSEEDIGAKNQGVVEKGQAALNNGDFSTAIEMFKESRDICTMQSWWDGVRYANEMLNEARKRKG